MPISYTRDDDDYLMVSGIQHFAFCPRQWALIHIEQQWQDNVLTTEGNHIHRRVDDAGFDECRGDLRTIRSVPILSEKLRIRGIADMVELRKTDVDSETTTRLEGRDGFWNVTPVEYKRGKPKIDDRDAVQLCAQAMCLEEMMGVLIPQGVIYYAEIRRREPVTFSLLLRDRVLALILQMQRLYEEGRTPSAEFKKHCEQCSLLAKCKPRWSSSGAKSAAAYIKKWIERRDEPYEGC